MTPRLLGQLLVLVLVLASSRVHADDDTSKPSYRAVIDHVELEPSSLSGYNLRIHLSALSLQGQILDLSEAKSIKLYLGQSEKKLPYALGTYDQTQSESVLVILVQATLDYTDALPLISDSLDRDLLAHLNERTQIAVLQYGESTGTGKLSPIKNVRGKVLLASDNTAGDPAMLDTVDRALLLMKKAKPTVEGKPLRKIVVVVGDGRDLAADKDRVTRVGTRAAKEGVRIHTIAYSANDVRRPMLALGEMSKRSLGTFRWVRKGSADSFKSAFAQLHEEIAKQYVVSFFPGLEDEVAGKKMHVVLAGRTEATSNEVKIGEPMCGAAECAGDYCSTDRCTKYKEGGGRGVFGWILLIGGIAIGVIVVLGIVGFFMTKAQQSKISYPQQPAHPGTPVSQPPKPKKPKKGEAVVAPGLLPNGRPIPALLITSGPRSGERHLLRHGYMIGKQPGCDLLIEDGFTSSQHAQIGMDANGVCALYDRQSTNGTFVNGARITQTALQHGMTIKIGSTEMRFLAE